MLTIVIVSVYDFQRVNPNLFNIISLTFISSSIYNYILANDDRGHSRNSKGHTNLTALFYNY